ncbi:MAG: methyl-accepting chemotaxis protein, partial [Gammaproteobacteria bacterium]
MAISIVVSTWVARDAGWEALLRQTELRLTSERETKKHQIEEAFDLYKKQIITSSRNSMTINAASSLSASFKNYKNDIGANADIAKMKTILLNYYQSQFGAEYTRRNDQSPPDPNSIINNLSDNAITLQHNLIAANKHPLGQKQNLDKPNDAAAYSDEHNRYHPSYRSFVEYFGYYDLFIVDPVSGNIVYSVFKEMDYATSLINGPYANSGIGKAFKTANASTDPDFVAVEDFDVYIPSYNAPVAFMASPIFQDSVKIGILILQLPVEKINAITTSKQSWQQSGLGESGETYLVGADSKMRSVSRFFIESPEEYLNAAKANGLDDENANLIVKRGTTASLQSIQSEAFKKAIAGESGFIESIDYRGVPVLSAYAKLDILGLDWVILSEMDVAEAQLPSTRLSDALLMSSAVVASILAFLAI